MSFVPDSFKVYNVGVVPNIRMNLNLYFSGTCYYVTH